MRKFSAYLLVGAVGLQWGCVQKGSFEGKLVNGLTGDAVEGVRVLVKADSTDFACQVFEATTGADGAFSVEGTCPDHTYAISPSKDHSAWMLTGVGDVVGGETSTGAVEIKAWQAPGGSGVYVLSEGNLQPAKTAADIDTVTIWKTEVSVRYPNTVPNKVPRVGPGEHLVITGIGRVESLALHPLIESDKRRFGEPAHYFDMDPWVYIGHSFTSDSEYEVVETQLDDSKVVTAKGAGERAARYYAADAVPAGRYALLSDDDRRTYIVDFGAAAAEGDGAEGGEGEGG